MAEFQIEAVALFVAVLFLGIMIGRAIESHRAEAHPEEKDNG